MIHDQCLVDRLSALQSERFAGDVFRATGAKADPLAFSTSGGRWAPVSAYRGAEVAVLYTSKDCDGALAEVVSYLMLQIPLPKSRPLKVSRLNVSTSRTLTFARCNLEELGVDMVQYGKRDYRRTQEIGGALAFLGIDGLIAPSARWNCDNLMIYQANHLFSDHLAVVAEDEIDWFSWAQKNYAHASGSG